MGLRARGKKLNVEKFLIFNQQFVTLIKAGLPILKSLDLLAERLTDPKLGRLRNNGGPTKTMALLPGSPAIDSGNPSGCADSKGHLLKTDQRGQPRHDKEDSSGCDRGAYERQKD